MKGRAMDKPKAEPEKPLDPYKRPDKFNPCDTTTAKVCDWIRAGDFEEAKKTAHLLATFLLSLAQNKAAQQELIKAGVWWIGKDMAELIAEGLLADPKINKKAQENFHNLIKAGHRKGSDELKNAIEKLRDEPAATKGKTRKTGAELFAKVLVPNKPIKRQFEARWIAAVAYRNLENNTKEEYRRVATVINGVIDKNNQLIADWKQGKSKDITGYSPAIPKRIITPDQLEKNYRKFKTEIDRTNGKTIHRIK
jgi:hypothetical protein